MPRRSKEGKIIFPATEVAEYALCPESWRLKELVRVKKEIDLGSIKTGKEEHKTWAALLDKAADLLFVIKLIIILIGIMIIIVTIRQMYR